MKNPFRLDFRFLIFDVKKGRHIKPGDFRDGDVSKAK
jgi:hypothetical protein